MPWCSSCDRYLTPNSATVSGACPTCGSELAEAELAAAATVTPDDPSVDSAPTVGDDDDVEKIPWHFWLLVVALVLYLGWRVIEGVAWFF